jgi:hypothetical protein
MNELALAAEMIEKSNEMIADRDKKLYDANVYRCAIKHGGANALWASRMERLQLEASQLQEEIDFNLAFAQNIISRAA